MSFKVTDEILEKIVNIQRRVLALSKLAAEKDCGITVSSLLSGSVNAIDVTVYIAGKPLGESTDGYTWFYDVHSTSDSYEGMCAFLDKWETEISFPVEEEGTCQISIDKGVQNWRGRVWECSHCSTEFMTDTTYVHHCPNCGCGLDLDANGEYEKGE